MIIHAVISNGKNNKLSSLMWFVSLDNLHKGCWIDLPVNMLMDWSRHQGSFFGTDQ